MFLVIDDQNARQQLQFVPEDLHGHGSWKKGRIHENASSKRQIIRDQFRALKRKVRWRVSKLGLVGEHKVYVYYLQRGLVDQKRGKSCSLRARKSHLPGSLAIPQVFDTAVSDNVNHHRRKKGDDEMFGGIITHPVEVEGIFYPGQAEEATRRDT